MTDCNKETYGCDTCSNCIHSNPDCVNIFNQHWCNLKNMRVDSSNPACYRFERICDEPSYPLEDSNSDANNNSKNPGCYLTTVLCEILKANDNNPFLNTMRSFRGNILQKDDKYKQLLVEYDIIGPEIAKNLINDPLKYQIAANAFGKYIKPITDLIRKKDYEQAVNMYVEMTNKLKSFYNIETTVSINAIKEADINYSGHGVYTKKITV